MSGHLPSPNRVAASAGAQTPASCRGAGATLFCPAVPRLDSSLIEVYVFRRRERRVEFLLLRRHPSDTLPGVWQPVTGTLRRGETAARGALREVREETGVRALRLWRLESVRGTYDQGREAIRFITRFAAELGPRAEVRRSREHTAHRFASVREAARRVLWESQRDGFAEVARQVLRGGARARALEIALPRGRS
jgi:8-oxo-dGTP pyrophosphatase MutT (NUDIX family)